MADTGFSLGTLGTGPAASPDAVKANRLLAQALQLQGTSTEPIRSPWQGVGRIAQSVFGGLGQYQADQSELAARQAGAQHLADALKNNDLGAAVGAMASPWVPQEAAKAVAGIITPQVAEDQYGRWLVNRNGQIVPNSYVSKTANAPQELGPGVKTNTFYQGTGPGQPPVQIQPGYAGAPAAGGRAANAPPAGAVGKAPAAPMPTVSPQTQADVDWANQNTANREGMTKRAEADEKMLGSIREEGMQSKQKLDQLEQFRKIAQKAGYGMTDELKTWLGNRGIDTKGYTEDQLYKSAISFMAPQLRPEGSGRIMGQEYSGFKDALGSLMTTPAGREVAINYLQRTHQWGQQAGQIANEQGTSSPNKIGRIMNIQLPQLDMSAIEKANQANVKSNGPESIMVKHSSGATVKMRKISD